MHEHTHECVFWEEKEKRRKQRQAAGHMRGFSLFAQQKCCMEGQTLFKSLLSPNIPHYNVRPLCQILKECNTQKISPDYEDTQLLGEKKHRWESAKIK